jgi:translation initiation factor IF-1
VVGGSRRRVLARRSDSLAEARVSLVVGDRVRVTLSPSDQTPGSIVCRT